MILDTAEAEKWAMCSLSHKLVAELRARVKKAVREKMTSFTQTFAISEGFIFLSNEEKRNTLLSVLAIIQQACNVKINITKEWTEENANDLYTSVDKAIYHIETEFVFKE